MSLKIVRRLIGDITILDCIGRSTLGQGASMFRDVIQDLVSSGRKKIILNFSELEYSDSSGQAELVSAFTRIENNGGSLVLLNPVRRVKELLRIMNLYTVFQVFEDEASAIRYLAGSRLHCLCPICGAQSSPARLDGSCWPPQTCCDSNCGAQFTLASSFPHPATEQIETVRIPTYAEEYFEIAAGTPFKISIVGRLNLFTSSGLDKFWRVLPARIALFDLHDTAEITAEGRDALLLLVSQSTQDEAAAISLEGVAPEQAHVFPCDPPVYPDNATALAALGDLVAKTPAWFARFQ